MLIRPSLLGGGVEKVEACCMICFKFVLLLKPSVLHQGVGLINVFNTLVRVVPSYEHHYSVGKGHIFGMDFIIPPENMHQGVGLIDVFNTLVLVSHQQLAHHDSD